MQLITSLVGGSGNVILNAVLALAVVLVLVFLALWALKLVMRASNNVVRGGSRKRLAVVDTLPVDGKRQLVIIRRDNVEHLILTGGPQDVVVETVIAIEALPTGERPIPTVRSRQTAAAPTPAQPQRAGAPQRAPAQETLLPVPSNDEAPPRSPLERLRDLGSSGTGQSRPGSVRHTGLMRPVSRMEPGFMPANADNSIPAAPDSATTGRIMPFGAPRDGNRQEFGDDGTPGGHRDEGY